MLPSPFGRGVGGEGCLVKSRTIVAILHHMALTLTLSQRERGLLAWSAQTPFSWVTASPRKAFAFLSAWCASLRIFCSPRTVMSRFSEYYGRGEAAMNRINPSRITEKAYRHYSVYFVLWQGLPSMVRRPSSARPALRWV